MKFQYLWKIGIIATLIWLSACAPASAPAISDGKNDLPGESVSQASPTSVSGNQEPLQEGTSGLEVPEPESPDIGSPQSLPTAAVSFTPAPTRSSENDNAKPSGEKLPEAWLEDLLVEFEFPNELKYGDSDVIRLSLVPIENGYIIQSEFANHQIEANQIQVDRPEGFDLWGIAQVDGVGFNISEKNQEKLIPLNEKITWRWTLIAKNPGTHRMFVSLKFRWVPKDQKIDTLAYENEVFSKAFEVKVRSILGLNRNQSIVGGFSGLILSSAMGLAALFWRPKSMKFVIDEEKPDQDILIESLPSIDIGDDEKVMMQALFQGYGRLLIEREFRSGYSGARTLLVLPVHSDGRYDAETIIKIGSKKNITREYQNYMKFVKQTLPPLTARIQKPPVTVSKSDLASIQYTFIAEPGKPPQSLRQLLTKNQDASVIMRLFDSFGPAWWYQNQPYAYRLDKEYDQKLPSHFYIQPVPESKEKQKILIDENIRPANLNLQIGDHFELGNFSDIEKRSNGTSYTLIGKTFPDSPPLRLRWLSSEKPKPGPVEVVVNRSSLYLDWTRNMDLHGFEDPYKFLQTIFYETIEGTRSIIHGDLNLENVLVGPGGLIWLIDFAETRLGPPIQDIAHLYVEIIAHIISFNEMPVTDFIKLVRNDNHPLIAALFDIARQIVKAGTNMREYRMGLLAALIGALKYENLNPKNRYFLYLAAAIQVELIKNQD